MTTAKLAYSAVTNDKIASNAVTVGKIADNAVTGAEIVDYSIANVDLGSGAVDERTIADNAVHADNIINRTIKAIDVSTAPNSGIYVSKEQLDYNEVVVSLPAGSQGPATASCKDSDDLPLTWACTSLSNYVEINAGEVL